MISSSHIARLLSPLEQGMITTIDSHTEGEITRLITGGTGDIPGSTMAEKRRFFMAHLDHVRTSLTRSPRGEGLLAAMLTPPVSPDAAFGLIYMDARRYPYLCGHATIGAVVTLVRCGVLDLPGGQHPVRVDTPSGVMTAQVRISQGRLSSVGLDMVPAFVGATDQKITVEGTGELTVDLVCTGGYFAMVDTAQLGLTPTLENKARLVDLGMEIIEAANRRLTVTHPTRPEVNTVDVTEFYDSDGGVPAGSGRGMVIYGERHMDHSPCGTGTAAKLALLHHRGKIGLEQPYINAGPLGTTFKARLVEKVKIGDKTAVVTRIEGRAWITGVHRFVMEPDDPFQEGIVV